MMDSTFRLKNPNLNENDYLYHLGLSAKDNLQSRFGDIKFVCTGGKSSRIKLFAEEMYKKLGEPKNSDLDDDNKPRDIGETAGRYALFKVGKILLVSHGIGMASLSVVLNEMFKLLHYAKCNKDVKVIRIGSSGGLGVDPGTLVITNKPYNSSLEWKFKHVWLGEKYSLPCSTADGMRSKLLQSAKNLGLPAVIGNTMATDDFFEGQGRVDGAFCDYEEGDKMRFLRRAHDKFGIRNIEMECTCLAALCNRAGLDCAVICPTFLNRLDKDIVDASADEINAWQDRSFKVVGEYILSEL